MQYHSEAKIRIGGTTQKRADHMRSGKAIVSPDYSLRRWSSESLVGAPRLGLVALLEEENQRGRERGEAGASHGLYIIWKMRRYYNGRRN